MTYRELAVIPEIKNTKRELQIQTIKSQLKKYSGCCFNCGNGDWGSVYGGQVRKFISARAGWWFISARPEHNKRKCKNCRAKWLEEIGNFGK